MASLSEVARFKLPESTAFQSGPLLIDGTMFVTTATNTYAFDPRTGEQRWVQHFEPKSMGIGTPVRGVGYADGRLFRGTPDGHLLALDAKTGKVIWDVVGANAAVRKYPGRPLLCGTAASIWRTPAATSALSGTSAPSAHRTVSRCGASTSYRQTGRVRKHGPRTNRGWAAVCIRHSHWIPIPGSSIRQPATQDQISSQRTVLVTTFYLQYRDALRANRSALVASVTPTAGGLVLTGDTKGNFLAFDAKNGKVLLKKPLGNPIGGGIVTYEIGGVQYVAVAGGMKNTVTQQTDSGPAWVAILSVAKQLVLASPCTCSTMRSARDLPRDYLEPPRACGVSVEAFRPLRFENLFSRTAPTYGALSLTGIGWTGGFGIDDKWLGDGHNPTSWRETNVRFRGLPFFSFRLPLRGLGPRRLVPSSPVGRRLSDTRAAPLRPGCCPRPRHSGGRPRSVSSRSPLLVPKRRLYITNSYFAPESNFVGLLTDAARRGVDVRILTAGPATDVRTVGWPVAHGTRRCWLQAFRVRMAALDAALEDLCRRRHLVNDWLDEL